MPPIKLRNNESVSGSLNQRGTLGLLAESMHEHEMTYRTSSQHEWESYHDGYNSVRSGYELGEIKHDFSKRINMKHLRSQHLKRTHSPIKTLQRVSKYDV